MRVSRVVVVVVAVGLMATACSKAGSGSSGASLHSAAAALQQPTNGTAAPATKNPLGGVGSTLADMAYIRGRAQPATGPCAAPDTCFGGPVTNTQAGATYGFTGVTTVNDLVSGYDQNFPTGTTIAAALGAVVSALPGDSHASAVTPIYGATLSCAFVNVSSPTIAALFPSQSAQAVGGGLSNTVVGVEFSGTNATGFQMYDPANVQVAKVSLGADSSSMAC